MRAEHLVWPASVLALPLFLDIEILPAVPPTNSLANLLRDVPKEAKDRRRYRRRAMR